MKSVSVLASLLILHSTDAWCLELPGAPLEKLRSETFSTREEGQGEILRWARSQQPDAVRDELFRQSQSAPDPEVRARCLTVLKDLVSEDYFKEGEGYIGVRMQDEFVTFPGDPKPRAVIRVTQIVPDSAAEKAGLLLNDLIGELDATIWREQPMTIPFGEKIRQQKPGAKVNLKVLRDGKVVDVIVTLGRRPLIADTPFFTDEDVDMEAMERAAQDAFFRRWLDRKKSAN